MCQGLDSEDMKLLKLSAKAMQFEISANTGTGVWVTDSQNTYIEWNPLLNNSQCFELMVKLGIGVPIPDIQFMKIRRACLNDINCFSAIDKENIYQAQRTAIVKAAAKIAENIGMC
jgi:hypothetical protein